MSVKTTKWNAVVIIGICHRKSKKKSTSLIRLMCLSMTSYYIDVHCGLFMSGKSRRISVFHDLFEIFLEKRVFFLRKGVDSFAGVGLYSATTRAGRR